MASRIKHPNEGSVIKKNVTKDRQNVRFESKSYRIWIRQLGCCITNVANSEVEAHHIEIGRYGVAMRNDDTHCVPLHKSLHDPQFPNGLHNVGERQFWNQYGIDPFAIAADLFRIWEFGDRRIEDGQAIIKAHRRLGQVRQHILMQVFETPKNTGVKS